MDSFFWAVAYVLLVALLAGLLRVAWGPTALDRISAAQLFGTTGTGILLLLAEATRTRDLYDVALVLALLAPLVTVAFVQTSRRLAD